MDKNLHIKKTIRTEEPLPDYLSWDQMEGGIMDSLEQKKSKKRIIWFLSFGALVMLFIVGYFLSFNNTQIIEQNTSGLKSDQTTFANTDKIDDKKLPIVYSSSSENSDTEKPVQSKNNSITNDSETNFSIPKKSPQTHHFNKIEKETHQAQANQTSYASRPSKFVQTGNQSLIQSNIQLQPNGVQKIAQIKSTKPSANLKQSQVNNLSKLSIYAKALQIENREMPVPERTNDKLILTIQKEHLARFSLSLLSSADKLNPTFSGSDLATAKNQSETGEYGLGSSLALNYQFAQNWELSSGITYQKLFTKFEYYHTTPGIVTVQTYQGARDVGVTNWRDIKHYNSYDIWSIPLSLNRLWNSSSKLNFKTGLGVLYNISGSVKGKTLGPSTENPLLYDIYEEQKDLYQLSNKFNLLANAEMNYSIGSRYIIGLSIVRQSSLSDLSNNTSFKFDSTVWRSGITIGYRL